MFLAPENTTFLCRTHLNGILPSEVHAKPNYVSNTQHDKFKEHAYSHTISILSSTNPLNLIEVVALRKLKSIDTEIPYSQVPSINKKIALVHIQGTVSTYSELLQRWIQKQMTHRGIISNSFAAPVPPGATQWKYVSTFKSIGATNQSNYGQNKDILT